MKLDQTRHYNSGFVRFLPEFDDKHPDSSGTILIYGPAADAASYIEIANLTYNIRRLMFLQRSPAGAAT